MSSKRFQDALTPQEICRIHEMREVIDGRSSLSRAFMLGLPPDIHQKLSDRFGFHLSNPVPCRWMRGDTPHHTDIARDRHSFENTYLVYLSDSEGVLRLGQETYPIRAGDGFRFSHEIPHATTGTRSADRLLLGPLNERSVAVGFSGVYYTNDTNYFSQQATSGILLTIDEINTIGGSGTPFVIPSGQVFAGWRYSAEYSYGDQTVGGQTPTDGDIFAPGLSYSTTGGIYLQVSFDDDNQHALNVLYDNLYIQSAVGKIVAADVITQCQLTEKLGVNRSSPITNEIFFQRSRANTTIPSRNGFATR